MPIILHTQFGGAFADIQKNKVIESTTEQDKENPHSDDDKDAECWDWKCYLCYHVNDAEVDRCVKCFQLQRPTWLYIAQGTIPVSVGLRICLRSEFKYTIGIITRIHLYTKQVDVHVIQQDTKTLGLVTYAATDLAKMEELSHASLMHKIFNQHGLCPDCRQVFRIANTNSPQRQELEQRRYELELELSQEETKKELLKLSQLSCEEGQEVRPPQEQLPSTYVQVLECTKKIKLLRRQWRKVVREAEPVQVFCPFCALSEPSNG